MVNEEFDRRAGETDAVADEEEKVTAAAEEVPAQDELERLRAGLEKANSESQDHFRLLQRAQADLVNYRRRVEQERGESIRNAQAEVVSAILPVLDDFELALKSIPPERAGQSWVEGVSLIERKLRGALEALGVTQDEVLGKQFDPWEHEAVMSEATADREEGEITGVLRPGYKLHGKVIRPAQVKVAKGT